MLTVQTVLFGCFNAIVHSSGLTILESEEGKLAYFLRISSDMGHSIKKCLRFSTSLLHNLHIRCVLALCSIYQPLPQESNFLRHTA